MKAPMVIGYWSSQIEAVLTPPTWDTKSRYLIGQEHEGPTFKFPAPSGSPNVGQLVICFASWDHCINRGSGNHRGLVRRIVRVKPVGMREGMTYYDLVIAPPGVPWGIDLSTKSPLRLQVATVPVPELISTPGELVPPWAFPSGDDFATDPELS